MRFLNFYVKRQAKRTEGLSNLTLKFTGICKTNILCSWADILYIKSQKFLRVIFLSNHEINLKETSNQSIRFNR